MKKALCLFLAMLMSLSLVSCGSSGGTTSANASSATSSAGSNDFKGEKLVVGVWGGTIEQVLRDAVVTPMEDEYGCQIELVLGGTADRKAKLYAEAGNPSMDVLFLNIFESKQAIDNGVAEPVDTSLSNFNQLYDFAQTGGYGMSIMGLGIVYNNDLVKTPITSWKDLWRDDLKGKVAFPNYPGFEGDGLINATAQAWGLDIKTQSDQVFAKLAELKPVPLFYSNLDELFLEMKQGTILAAPLFNSYANDYIDQGYPVQFVYPSDPGAILAKDTIVIAKGTKHDALAKEFVNRCISVDTQTAYAEKIFFGPCNKDVVLPDDVASKLVYGDNVKKLVSLDWDYILTQQDNWTEMWNRQLAAG